VLVSVAPGVSRAIGPVVAPAGRRAVIEKSESTSRMQQQAVMRRVILWCVEAYFGHLGGHLHEPIIAEPIVAEPIVADAAQLTEQTADPT